MRPLGVVEWFVTVCLVAAALSGCAKTALPRGCCPSTTVQEAVGGSYVAQAAADFGPLTSVHVDERSDPAGSWISPDSVTEDLLYVTDVKTVTVYSYPQVNWKVNLRAFIRRPASVSIKKATYLS
jgi:hypothetical protein